MAALSKLKKKSIGVTDFRQQGRLNSTAIHVLSFAAEAHLDDLDFASCFELCEDAYTTLLETKVLYEQHGEDPPHDSTAICGLLTNLANAKWKYAENCKDYILPSEEMVELFKIAARRILTKTQLENIGRQQAEDRYQSLLWCGIVLLKQSLRFNPELVNGVQDSMLEVYEDALSRTDWPFYWDERIARMVFAGRATWDSLDHCYRIRYDCIKALVGNTINLTAYRKAAANEMKYLFDHCSPHLKVI